MTLCETCIETKTNTLLATLKTWADKERQEKNSYILSIETILKEHNLLCFCQCWPYNNHKKGDFYKPFRKSLELILKKITELLAYKRCDGIIPQAVELFVYSQNDFYSFKIGGDFPSKLTIVESCDGQSEGKMWFLGNPGDPDRIYGKFKIDNRQAVKIISETIEKKSRKYQKDPTEIDTYLVLGITDQLDSSEILETISSKLRNKEISCSPFKKVFYKSNKFGLLFP